MFTGLWSVTWFLVQLGWFVAIGGLLLWIDYCIIRLILKAFGVNLPKHPIKELKRRKEEAKAKEEKVEVVDLSDKAK